MDFTSLLLFTAKAVSIYVPCMFVFEYVVGKIKDSVTGL